ncbi:MAG TPA: galactose-1-phosphate uridylyltransferase [Vicinamibacterales bacterium]|jgi:UDPglucose--hexose-1-phosphate uridylyltransferase|nr:galactose-1-phosphate uridylyltransferase [Vicinamibacterales bacterium]
MTSELRRDPVSGRWVIIAAERGRRPSDFRVERPVVTMTAVEPCPFCEGNESLTPPEVFADRASGAADSTGWDIRIVPNKFPALQLGGTLTRESDGLFERMAGVGAHEVVIDTPDHRKTFATMTGDEIARVLEVCRARVRALKQDVRLRYVIVFKNHGAQAGATREHSHGQLIGLPIVPDFVREESDGARDYFAGTNRCVFCDMLRQERGGARAILEHGQAVVIAPYASRSPFETWLVPKRHDASFEDAPEPVVHDMAGAIKAVLERLNRVVDDPPYNLIVHTAPFEDGHQQSFHWHIELVPRLSRTAGFEWGTGFYINATSPESAAAALRDVPA